MAISDAGKCQKCKVDLLFDSYTEHFFHKKYVPKCIATPKKK